MWNMAGMRTVVVSVVVMLNSSVSRRRNAAANCGRGRRGTSGRCSASKGSVVAIGLPSLVGGAERGLGPHEQGLGRMDGAVQVLGHVGNGKPVHVSQHE